MGARSRSRGLIVWTALWLAAVAAGMAALWRYKTIPGEAGAAPGRWPAASGVSRSRALPTLVLAAHPRCPCTRASLSELAGIMARLRGHAGGNKGRDAVISLGAGDAGGG